MLDTPQRRLVVMLVANQAWNLVNYRTGLIRALRSDGFDIIAVAPPDPVMEARLADMGCRFAALPLDAKGLSPGGELRTCWALFRLMRRYRPAAVLSWTIKANLWGALSARLNRIPAIANVSGLGIAHDGPWLLQKLSAALYRVCLASAGTVFFQNSADRGELVDAGLVREDQAALLPGSGVDVKYFSPRAGERPSSRRYILIARLLAPKGVREFVAAARALKPELPDLTFCLAGFLDVANQSAISKAEVDQWVAEGVVEYHPAVDDVRPLLQNAEAVVLPSYYREGLSRGLLEAAAMARPIITTDLPGCREAVENGVTGFLCKARDTGSLADAIRKMALLSPTEWAAFGLAGRARIEAAFTEDVVIDRYRQALHAAGISISETQNRSASS